MVEPGVQTAVDSWSRAAERLARSAALSSGSAAGPLSDLDAGPADEVGPAGPTEAQLEGEVEDLLTSSEAAITAIVGAAGPEDRGVSAALSILIGNVAVGHDLFLAGARDDSGLDSLGLDAAGGPSGTTPLLLDELRASLFGGPAPGTPLPESLTEQLESLEVAGADELVALARDAVLLGALKGAVSGLQVLDRSGTFEKAVDAVRSGLHGIRVLAVRVLTWTVDRLRSLLPEQFRAVFDDKVEDIRTSLSEDVAPILANIVGTAFGRRSAERAWQGAVEAGAETAEALEQVGVVVADRLRRIGQVSSARVAVGAVAAVLQTAVAAAAPHVQVVVGVLALLVVALVGYQLWDGFEECESLAPVPG